MLNDYLLLFYILITCYIIFYIRRSYLCNIVLNKVNTSCSNNESNHNTPYSDAYLRLPKYIKMKIIRNLANHNKNSIIDIVIATLSSPHNFKKRYSFRNIFHKFNRIKRVKLIFFIGNSNCENKYLLNEEFSKYNDIVQFSYQNSYFNLTLLSVMALEYCYIFFNNLKYYIKTDDDMLLNYRLLDELLNYITPFDNQIYGHLDGKFIANRNNNSKSYIPYFQYPFKQAPKYVYGGLIIIPRHSLKKIYNQTLFKQNYVWKEDVNIGILCNRANVDIKQFPNKNDIKIKEKECRIKEKIIAAEIDLPSDRFYCASVS